MNKKDKLSEILTQAELDDAIKDTYSSEERAKIESFLDLLEDWVRATVASSVEPESVALGIDTGKTREALIRGIESHM